MIFSVTVTLLQVSEERLFNIKALEALIEGLPRLFLTKSEDPVLSGLTAALLETAFDVLFLIEFLLRIVSAPSKKEYLKDALNWADILSASGLFWRISIGFILRSDEEPARQVVQVTRHLDLV